MKPRSSLFLRLAPLSAVVVFGFESAAEIDFNDSIRPILNAHCVSCHGGVKKASGISFLSREEALGEGKSGARAIVPHDVEDSELLQRVRSSDPDDRMPPPDHGPALSAVEIELLEQWIKEGAPWKEHWAFEPPELSPLPEVSDPDWCQTPIDRFLLHRLDEEGLSPNPPASKEALLRRLSFDLTGLPPTPDQLATFLANDSPETYANAVDDLLQSPAFGERWAAVWLDLARYADSDGLGVDGRRETWAYRDWLVRAFSENKPFDEFIVEQLAGDLLPDPTTDQLVATAFHRQTQSNGEGGTDDEEFRVVAVMDRASTTWEVFQGVTFGCVQCHDHPYDPIENDEYYQFLSFFNNTADADLGDAWPRVRVPNDRKDHSLEQNLRREIGERSLALTQEARQRLEATSWWTPSLSAIKATSSGNGVKITEGKDGFEFLAQGNIRAGTEYFFEITVPETLNEVTALRIDMMPVDEEAAKHTPEWSGILSRIQLEISPSGTEDYQPVALARVIGDEADPVYDPNDSLKRGGGGFGAMSKIFHRRSCVVIPEEPLALSPGTVLMVSLKHDIQALGAFPLVTQRGALHLSDESDWSTFSQDAAWTRLAELRRRYREIPSSSVPVMRERPSHLERESRTFVRGNWLEKGEPVAPGTPAFLPPMPENAPKNRLGMARWLVSQDNPLTARVAVNRFWEQLFGDGIVPTLEDFGAAGQKPTHPELLDWLALTFRDTLKWDVKELLRLIVLSAAYRQDAAAPAELHERDPQNLWLARGPRNRLKAEMIRDGALAASGLLSDKQYGPPVRPPLPDGVWKPFARDPWETEEDADRYRRAVYVYWKRSIPFPSLVTFDAPSRELCTQRRLPSNTPLQALVTLNDPVFVEAAQALSRRMKEAHPTLTERLRLGHRLTTSRLPEPQRLEALTDLYEEILQTYEKDRPEGVTNLEDAALEVMASVLINLDEALSK